MRRFFLLALVLPFSAAAHSEDRIWGEGARPDESPSYAQSNYEARGPADPRDGYAARDDGYEDLTGAPPAGFREPLARYGEWIDTDEYGLVWRPTQVGADWRPYSDGQWVATRFGWTWVTDEPWGWAVYHYGRWAQLRPSGWVWIPGRVWAPAWVAWRWGGGFIGWCPLGPSGIAFVEPLHWVFVPAPVFLFPVRRHIVPIVKLPILPRLAAPAPLPPPRAWPFAQSGTRFFPLHPQPQALPPPRAVPRTLPARTK